MLMASAKPIDLRLIAAAVGIAVLTVFLAWAVVVEPHPGGKPYGVDARAYWAADWSSPYAGPEAGLSGAYLYSPAFLQAISPLRLLPWETFMAVWLVAELAALAWLVTPLGAVALLIFPPIASEVLIGNVHTFLAVALVLSVRHPTAWLLALLTKPTLGVVLLYHRWRSWLRVAALLVAIAAVSAVIVPDWWADWFVTLRRAENRGGPLWTAFLAVRLLVAAVISWYAGWRKRPAWLPVAAYLVLPIPWLEGLVLFAAVPRLLRVEVTRRAIRA